MPWFEVTAEVYDWIPRPGVMMTYRAGRPHFGTRACVDRGVEAGKIRRIAKPAGWRVGKDGKVRRDDRQV